MFHFQRVPKLAYVVTGQGRVKYTQITTRWDFVMVMLQLFDAPHTLKQVPFKSLTCATRYQTLRQDGLI